MAFFPQFVQSKAPLIPQFLILGATFLLLAVINATTYAFFASALSSILRKTSAQRWFQRIVGIALIGAGLITAMLKPS